MRNHRHDSTDSGDWVTLAEVAADLGEPLKVVEDLAEVLHVRVAVRGGGPRVLKRDAATITTAARARHSERARIEAQREVERAARANVGPSAEEVADALLKKARADAERWRQDQERRHSLTTAPMEQLVDSYGNPVTW